MDITVKKHIGKKLNNYDDIRGISESLVCVRRNGNWGFINEEGKEVVKPIYDNAHCFSEGLARVEINDKWGFINKDGEEVIKPIYDLVGNFSEGLARVKKNDKCGLINKKGEEVVKPIYDYIYDFEEGLASVEINDKWGFINKDGEEVIKPIYDDVCDFQYGLARVQKIGKYGLVNKEGKEVVKPIYNDIVYDEKIAIVKKNNSLYIVDLNIPTYEVSVDSQDRIIKRQFSNESKADEFLNAISSYIEKRSQIKNEKENEINNIFELLKKQYEKDILEINNSYKDDVEKEFNVCYKKSMN